MATTSVDIETTRHDAAGDNATLLDELRTIVGRRHVSRTAGCHRRQIWVLAA
jgi:hypothetical protein